MSEIVDNWRSLQKGPRVPRQQEPPKTPRYNVQEIQSSRPTTPASTSFVRRENLTIQQAGKYLPRLVSQRPELLSRLAGRGKTGLMATLAASGFNLANAQRLANEALAAEHGLTAVYNAAQVGEQTVRTTQGFQYGGPFGEIFSRAGGKAANMNVAYIDDLTSAAGRASAIADETITRGQGVTDAYQYVRLPAERFNAFGPVTDALKKTWRGISQASQATTAFSFLPLEAMKMTMADYILESLGMNVYQSMDI